MIERSRAAASNRGDLSVGFTTWNEPLERPLREGEVQIWRADVSVQPRELRELRDVLSPDERARAARFRFPRDRDRFIAARALLRRLLARYNGERPERLRFTTGPFGKPRLDSQPGGGRVEFNLSHSGAETLYAVAGGRGVGVDVERVLSVAKDDERLSSLWLSAAEVAEISAMGAAARARAFYSLWTRKEAYVKARGEGLSLAPDRVRVCGVRVSQPGESARWSLREVPVGPEYAAAVAVEGECDAYTLRQWIGPSLAFSGPT